MNVRIPLLYVCFFLSGAAALIYQIVWQRMLTLVFGLSTVSVAAVLAAFLAGLALGARWAGPLTDRSKQPTRLYAWVELGIAVLGLATLVAIPLLMEAFTALYALLAPGWFGSNLIRFGLAFIAVGVPSLFIGATVPVMARMIAEHAGSTAIGFGRSYAVNTAGSVCGAALAGFYLLRLIGTQNALFCAVAGNLVVVGLALLVARVAQGQNAPAAETADPHASRAPDSATQRITLHPRFALSVAALTGFLALAYEVAWIRLLAVFTLNSVYVFAMVVSVYLAALSIGAAIATALLRVARLHVLTILAVCQLLLALTVPVMLFAVPFATELNIISGDLSEREVFMREYGLVAAIVFAPTLLIGITLPLLVSLASQTVANSGKLVGRIYAWNAVGTIAGAALTGVVLIPFLGLRGTLMLLASGNLIIVAAAAYAADRPSKAFQAMLPAGAALFAVLLALLPGAVRFYVPRDIPGEKVLYYAEGPSATVHVAEYGEDGDTHRALFVDSKSVAGTYDEIVTDQKMLAHLPLLLHPDPQRALTVGFGTGGTSFSMLQHRIKVDCVEIEPRVPEAFALFKSENFGLVGPQHDSVNYQLVLDDARAWLHVAPHQYDVIVTDLTSIQYRGNGNLYTAECFQLSRDQLKPGGIGAAWVPITGITPQALKVLINTFQTVFPHTSVWYSVNLPTDFVILIGTDERLALDLAAIQQRMAVPLVQKDLARIGMDNVYKLAAGLLLADNAVRNYVGDAALHTDNRPVLDYLTHAAPYQNTFGENMRQLLAQRVNAAEFVVTWPDDDAESPPERWQNWFAASELLIQGHMAIRSNAPGSRRAAREAYAAALELVPQDARTRRLVNEVSPTAANTRN
jgi:spermidine synthase